MDGSAEIVDLQPYLDVVDVAPFVRATTLRRIRLLRQMLDRLELRVGTGAGVLDIADVGTDEMLSLAGLYFDWAFQNPPPPDFRKYHTEAWREWCREVANRR